jgi:hypothetical protein
MQQTCKQQQLMHKQQQITSFSLAGSVQSLFTWIKDFSGNIVITNPAQWISISGNLTYYNTVGIGLINPNKKN